MRLTTNRASTSSSTFKIVLSTDVIILPLREGAKQALPTGPSKRHMSTSLGLTSGVLMSGRYPPTRIGIPFSKHTNPDISCLDQSPRRHLL